METTDQEREKLESELNDEFDDPVEASPEDLRVEANEPLTGAEEEWRARMVKEVKEWKHDRSQYSGVERYIGGIKVEDLDADDQHENLALFHAFDQARKSPSPYFRQKRDRLIRKRVRDTQGDYASTGYQFAKIIEALSQTE